MGRQPTFSNQKWLAAQADNLTAAGGFCAPTSSGIGSWLCPWEHPDEPFPDVSEWVAPRLTLVIDWFNAAVFEARYRFDAVRRALRGEREDCW